MTNKCVDDHHQKGGEKKNVKQYRVTMFFWTQAPARIVAGCCLRPSSKLAQMCNPTANSSIACFASVMHKGPRPRNWNPKKHCYLHSGHAVQQTHSSRFTNVCLCHQKRPVCLGKPCDGNSGIRWTWFADGSWLQHLVLFLLEFCLGWCKHT